MKRLWFAALLFSCLALLVACSHAPQLLGDSDVIPVGSRVTFWVNHDDDGWLESNIHIDYLPRPMSGAEARRWAEGVGARDAGLHWTQYYVLATPPGADGRVWRSAVHNRPSSWDPASKRL